MSKRKLKYGNDWFDTIHSEIRVPVEPRVHREPRVQLEPINTNVIYPQMAPCPPGYRYRPKRKPGQRKCTKETVKSVLSFLQMLATQNRISIFKPRKDKKGYTRTLLTIPQLKSRLTRHGISYKNSQFGMLKLARLKKGLLGYSPPPEYSLREPLEEPKARVVTSAKTLPTIIETLVETRPKTVDQAMELLAAKGLVPFNSAGAPKPKVDARVTKTVQGLLREWGIDRIDDSSSDSEVYDDDDSFDPFDSFDRQFGMQSLDATSRAMRRTALRSGNTPYTSVYSEISDLTSRNPGRTSEAARGSAILGSAVRAAQLAEMRAASARMRERLEAHRAAARARYREQQLTGRGGSRDFEDTTSTGFGRRMRFGIEGER